MLLCLNLALYFRQIFAVILAKNLSQNFDYLKGAKNSSYVQYCITCILMFRRSGERGSKIFHEVFYFLIDDFSSIDGIAITNGLKYSAAL